MKYSKIAAILASLILCYLTDGLIGFGADLGEQENLENPKSLTRPFERQQKWWNQIGISRTIQGARLTLGFAVHDCKVSGMWSKMSACTSWRCVQAWA